MGLLVVAFGAGIVAGQGTNTVQGDVIGSPIAKPSPSTASSVADFVAAAAAAAAPAATNNSSGDTGFDKLSGFPFKVTDDMIIGVGDAAATSRDITGQIPATVKSLDGREVSITGFMLPTKVDDGKATEFLLLKNQSMCCYGMMPNLNEYVAVRMSGKGVKPIMDRLITVTGTLRVGEIRQNRLLIGIYQMDGGKMDAPPSL